MGHNFAPIHLASAPHRRSVCHARGLYPWLDPCAHRKLIGACWWLQSDDSDMLGTPKCRDCALLCTRGTSSCGVQVLLKPTKAGGNYTLFAECTMTSTQTGFDTNLTNTVLRSVPPIVVATLLCSVVYINPTRLCVL